jgi:hypothetical protein
MSKEQNMAFDINKYFQTQGGNVYKSVEGIKEAAGRLLKRGNVSATLTLKREDRGAARLSPDPAALEQAQMRVIEGIVDETETQPARPARPAIAAPAPAPAPTFAAGRPRRPAVCPVETS